MAVDSEGKRKGSHQENVECSEGVGGAPLDSLEMQVEPRMSNRSSLGKSKGKKKVYEELGVQSNGIRLEGSNECHMH